MARNLPKHEINVNIKNSKNMKNGENLPEPRQELLLVEVE